MKKICFVTTVPITIKMFILKTAEYLHNNTDWDISIICSDEDGFENELPNYIRYFPVHMERGISLSGFSALFEMISIFKREKFDLIQYSTPNAAMYASFAGKLAKIPNRLYCQWGMAFKGMNGVKRKIFKIMEKIICKFSTEIEPDSFSNLDFAHSNGIYKEDKGHVVWNGSACGINLDKFDILRKMTYRREIRNKYNLTDNCFVFGFVGRITKNKGVNELIEGFKTIVDNNQNDNIYLMMVGPNESDGTINKELFDWSVDCENVIYTGFTNEVEKYFSAFDVYVLPSYHEGFGMSILEAEAMGVPVVVTNIPGPVDAMQKDITGVVIETNNVSQLISAMENLMNDKEKLKRFGLQGTKYANENFEQKKLFEYILQDRKKLLGD